MTTTAPLPPAEAWPTTPDAGLEPTPTPPEGPGRLRIDPRVVQKLAARAAGEVDGISQARVAPVGRALHRPLPATTPADQLSVDLDVTVSIRYPLPLPATVEQMAAHLARRFEQLAGRPLGRLSVHVQALVGADGGGRPRVR